MMYHCCLDVRNFMRQAAFPHDYGIFKHPDGRHMAPEEAKAMLIIELVKGNEVVPVGSCDNFNPKTGCQGHPEEARP